MEIISDVDYLETWRVMEDLVDAGFVRSIGVSNFNCIQLERLNSLARIKPVVNQIECCPTLNQREMLELCSKHNIVVVAYCPLRHPEPIKRIPPFLIDERVREIADKYGKTNVQICLRFLIQLGAVPIPKSICEDRLRSNIDVFDFELSEEEMQLMHSFNTGERLYEMSFFRNSKYFPFINEILNK